MKVTNNLVLCHIVGMNPDIKDKFMTKFDNNDRIEIIDLDFISDKIFNSRKMKELYKNYEPIKHKKNKRSKDAEKEITVYWLDQMKIKLEEEIYRLRQKEIIVIGQNHHHKYSGRKIKIPTDNNYIVKNNACRDAECIVRFNLENYHDQIVKGVFPIKYLDFNFLKQKKEKLIAIYKKRNYEEISLKDLYKSLDIYMSKVLKY